MNELSLFSGAGGGLLGTKLLGWNHIGYVEINEYCQQIIKQRIEDGIFDEAPIFTDVREFLQSGAARKYRGFVDVVTAGFPCQPFSVAGKQAGENDERNMWPETIAILREVRPRYALLENVPGLLSHPYARRIFGDLAESGFNVRWRVLSAAECGAPHKRDRVWIIANSKGTKCNRERPKPARESNRLANICENVADTKRQRLQGHGRPINAMRTEEEGEGQTDNIIANGGWSIEPDVGRVANGVANRTHRLKALGNGQVSICVALAFLLLSDKSAQKDYVIWIRKSVKDAKKNLDHLNLIGQQDLKNENFVVWYVQMLEDILALLPNTEDADIKEK